MSFIAQLFSIRIIVGKRLGGGFLLDQTLEIISSSACLDVNICARLRNISLKLLSGHQMVKMAFIHFWPYQDQLLPSESFYSFLPVFHKVYSLIHSFIKVIYNFLIYHALRETLFQVINFFSWVIATLFPAYSLVLLKYCV